MTFLFESTKKDLIRMRRDPVALLVWVGIPVFVGVLLVSLFGRGEVRPQGLLLVADQDDTIISSLIVSAYKQRELGEMLTVERVAFETGERRIRDGDGSALLVIPDGFSDAFLLNKPASLRLVVNPSQSVLPGIIEEVTSILLDAGYYLRRLLGEELRQFAELSSVPSDEMIASASIRISRTMADLAVHLDPPLIRLSTGVADTGSRGIEMAPLMFPSVMYMAVMFLGFGLSSDFWKEKKAGTLRRLLATPASMKAFLGGKLLSLAVVLLLLAIAGLAAGRWLAGMEVPAPIPALLWVMLSGTVFYLLVVLIQIHGGGERPAFVLSNLFVMILAMVGGSFFPFEMMPSFLADIGRLTPNGWALTQLKAILAGEIAVSRLLLNFAAATAIGSLAFAVAVRRLRKGFVQ